jgi:hypothetical protein
MAPPATSYDPAAESTHSGPRRSPWVIVLLVVAVLVLGGIIGYSLFQGLRGSDDCGCVEPTSATQSPHSSPVRVSDPPVQ